MAKTKENTTKELTIAEVIRKESKTMTVKEVATVLGVGESSVKRTVEKLRPVLGEVLTNNQGGYLFTEKQSVLIKQEIQKHHNLQTRQIDKTTTELEVISNAMKAMQDLQNLYNQKESEYKQIIQNQNKQLIEQKPKVELYDTAMIAENTYSMNEVAKILKLPFGNKTLFMHLRSMKILDENNIPYEKYIKNGYFKVVIKPTKIGNVIKNLTVTRVTQKGTDYIYKLLKRSKEISA